ncbi:flagellar assembly protein A [Campylobacter sp. CCS1377]|uniref:Flagellar assembly protein A n=1 Tax=Campylobacter sp. CCS1377 TaxID=3158229 RepID=A0AAU7E8J4_9BACT
MFNFKARYANSQIIESEDPYILLQKQTNKNFRILDFKTICTSNEDEIQEYSSDELSIFNDDNFFVNKIKKIEQKFIIELFPKEQLALNFKTILSSNENSSSIKILFEGENFLRFYDNFKEDLIQEVFKNMLKEHYLIGIRLKKEFFNDIDTIIAQLKNNTTSKKAIFSVANGVEPKQGKADEIIFYKSIENVKNLNEGKISYDQKSYAKPIEKNELLFEYIKPIEGKIGRNLKGKILKPKPLQNNGNTLKIDKNIITKDTREKISYYASSYGYLKKIGSNYSIIDELILYNVSLKNTGSIKSNTLEEISVEITNNNYLDESIKAGVKVEAYNVKIAGNVDIASVKSEFLSIGGKTHSKSKLYAKNAYINTHKGYLEADIAFIDNLENGTVIANTVIINTCMGATIKADKIYVKNALSYNCIHPKKFLLVDNINGDMNEFSVSPNHVVTANNEFYEDMVLAKELHNKISHINAQMKESYDFIFKNQNKVHYFKNINSNNPTHLKLIQNYENSLVRYKKLFENYQELVCFAYVLDTKLDEIYGVAFNAKIMIYNNEGNDNLIKFKVIHPRSIELRYILKKNDPFKLFHLKRNDKNPTIHKEENFPDEFIKWTQTNKENYFN